MFSRQTQKPRGLIRLIYNKFQSYTPKIDHIYKLRELMIKYKDTNNDIYMILLAFMNRYYIITSSYQTISILMNNYDTKVVYRREYTTNTHPWSVKYVNPNLGEIMLHYYNRILHKDELLQYGDKLLQFENLLMSDLNTDFNENVLNQACSEFEGDKRNCDEPLWMICNGLVPILGKYQARYISYIITPSYTGNLADLLLTEPEDILSLIDKICTKLEPIIKNLYTMHKSIPAFSHESHRLTSINMFTIFYNDYDLFFGGKLTRNITLTNFDEYMEKELMKLKISLYAYILIVKKRDIEKNCKIITDLRQRDPELEVLTNMYNEIITQYPSQW